MLPRRISAGNKAAVDAITKCLAKELGPRKIRMNSIDPGVVMTEGFVLGGLAGSGFEKQAVALTPLDGWGNPSIWPSQSSLLLRRTHVGLRVKPPMSLAASNYLRGMRPEGHYHFSKGSTDCVIILLR